MVTLRRRLRAEIAALRAELDGLRGELDRYHASDESDDTVTRRSSGSSNRSADTSIRTKRR